MKSVPSLLFFKPMKEEPRIIPFLGIGNLIDAGRAPYLPGEKCYVREAWTTTQAGMLLKLPERVLYKADFVGQEGFVDWKWSSPVTMPRWAARRHVRILSCVPEQRGEWGWRIEWEEVKK